MSDTFKPGAPFKAAPGSELPVGLRVVRGPGWSFGQQDGRRPLSIGAVEGWSTKVPSNAKVRWPDGKAYSYPADGSTLLVASEEQLALESANDELRKGPRAFGGPPGSAVAGKSFVRGPDWFPGNDAGPAERLVALEWFGDTLKVRRSSGDRRDLLVDMSNGLVPLLLPDEAILEEWKKEGARAEMALASRFRRWMRSANVWSASFGWFSRNWPLRAPMAARRLGIDSSRPEWDVSIGEKPLQARLARLLASRCLSAGCETSMGAKQLVAELANRSGDSVWIDHLAGESPSEVVVAGPGVSRFGNGQRVRVGVSIRRVRTTTEQVSIPAWVEVDVDYEMLRRATRCGLDGAAAIAWLGSHASDAAVERRELAERVSGTPVEVLFGPDRAQDFNASAVDGPFIGEVARELCARMREENAGGSES